MRKYIIVFTALIILISCEIEDDNKSNIRIDKELISELNSKSFDTLIIESDKYVLDAYLWRDFMPISPSDGKPMISINCLRKIDSTKIGENIDLVKQYVIYNDSIWISDYENEDLTEQPEYKVKKVSRVGPKWGPKIYVDVISKVRDYNTILNASIQQMLNNQLETKVLLVSSMCMKSIKLCKQIKPHKLLR